MPLSQWPLAGDTGLWGVTGLVRPRCYVPWPSIRSRASQKTVKSFMWSKRLVTCQDNCSPVLLLLQLSLALPHAFQPLLFLSCPLLPLPFLLLGFQLHSCVVTLPSVLALLHAFHSSLLLPHLLRPLPLPLLGFPVVLPCASRLSNVSCTVSEIVQMFIIVHV